MKYQLIINIDIDPKLPKEEAEKIIQKKYPEAVNIKRIKDYRTLQQNSALHLWFQQLADELNDKGFDMRLFVKKDINIEWSGQSIKEYLWRPLQKAKFGKKSTTQLFKTGEIDEIYDIINKEVIERTKGWAVCPPFPSDQARNLY